MIVFPTSVTVYKVAKDTRYVCRRVVTGWKCGHCRHGNFGLFPKVADACKVCHAVVTEVLPKDSSEPKS